MYKYRTLSILLLAVVLGCDDEPTGPTVQEVSGEYAATTLTLTQNGESTDLLAGGAELRIILEADGTTTGHVFLPNAGEGGGDFEASLRGSWTLSGDTVNFNQPDSDTFVESRAFIVHSNQLRSHEGSLDIVLQEEV